MGQGYEGRGGAKGYRAGLCRFLEHNTEPLSALDRPR